VSGDVAPLTTQFDRVVHEIDDAVVKFEIVDGEPIIVDANHAFRDIFSPDMKRVIGLALNDLIVPTGKQDEATNFDQRTAAGQSNVAFVTRSTTQGNRTFLYRGIPYEDNSGVAIYTDVTGELESQQTLTEIVTLAEQVAAEATTVQTRTAAAEIKAKAQRLVQFTDPGSTNSKSSDPASTDPPSGE